MMRIAASAVFWTVALLWPNAAAGESLDPAFAKVPLDEWARERERAPIRWRLRVSRAVLTNQQRLATHIEVTIDGRDLAERRSKGGVVIFLQVTDGENRRYQGHGSIDLSKLDEEVNRADISYSQSIFVQPGEYRLTAGILVTETGEHAARQQALRVPALKNDPLPDAWRNLPPVAFVQATEPPEAWFLPKMPGGLNLPATPPYPVHIEVLMNLAPDRMPASRRRNTRNLPALLPALKVLSQIEVPAPSEVNVAVLDLPRRRVAFRQSAGHGLDWPSLSAALEEGHGATIDVKSLEHRHERAAFFVRQVALKITGAGPGRPVVIVLSPPITFESGENLDPIQVESGTEARVFYIRYHAPPRMLRRFNRGPRRLGRMYPPSGEPEYVPEVHMDQLAQTLKPAGARVFDVRTPEQFRKTLATILKEISR